MFQVLPAAGIASILHARGWNVAATAVGITSVVVCFAVVLLFATACAPTTGRRA
jgi:hypothetical protein